MALDQNASQVGIDQMGKSGGDAMGVGYSGACAGGGAGLGAGAGGGLLGVGVGVGAGVGGDAGAGAGAAGAIGGDASDNTSIGSINVSS